MAKLLRLLEQDCTLTHEQLASMTDMTVADVEAAIQRYEADKTILGYQAIVDWDRTDREAVTALMSFCGIGRKVADCILLFGLHRLDAFPSDTHIKQILAERYPAGFPYDRYRGFLGVIQQYLFYYHLRQ